MNNFSQIFVVGDIHGCHIFLTQIHKKILDKSNNTSGNKLLIYLGDYIDRGSKIKETIQALLNFQPELCFENSASCLIPLLLRL